MYHQSDQNTSNEQHQTSDLKVRGSNPDAGSNFSLEIRNWYSWLIMFKVLFMSLYTFFWTTLRCLFTPSQASLKAVGLPSMLSKRHPLSGVLSFRGKNKCAGVTIKWLRQCWNVVLFQVHGHVLGILSWCISHVAAMIFVHSWPFSLIFLHLRSRQCKNSFCITYLGTISIFSTLDFLILFFFSFKDAEVR